LTTGPTPNSEIGAVPPREWDARAYHTVAEPQFEWGKRVLSTLELRGDEVAMDAGCGTGRLTTLLAERIPRGVVVGVDRSENMVRVAAETLGPLGSRATVVLADLSSLPFRAAFDVVFSTATFHWILDHDALFASVYGSLKAGGVLHAQCGGTTNLERIHRRARALTETPVFAPMFIRWRTPSYHADAETTRQRLQRTGFDSIETNLEPAPFVFPSAEAFATFVSTVVLRPFLALISDERLRKSFVAQITEAAAGDSPAYELDYCRLNIRARRP